MVTLADSGKRPDQAPTSDDDTLLLYRLAAQLRRESGVDLPVSYFLAVAKSRLAASPELARMAAQDTAVSRGPESSACFEAWARSEWK